MERAEARKVDIPVTFVIGQHQKLILLVFVSIASLAVFELQTGKASTYLCQSATMATTTPSKICKSYRYLPLQDSPLSIRLAVLLPGGRGTPIRVKLSQTTFAQRPKYVALSYTWGSPDVVREIELDNTPVDVRRNLWWALYHLRSTTEERLLWIDAICIDQSNIEERNQQVILMAHIFPGRQRL